MTTKLTTTITAAALAAFTAFAETNAPNAKSDETAALKARIEKLESDLATLKRQLFEEEPITNITKVFKYRADGYTGIRRDKPEDRWCVTFTGTVNTVWLNEPGMPEPLHESDKLRIDEKKREYKEWIDKRNEERDEKLRKEYGATKREWNELKKRTKSGSGVVWRRVLAEIRESNSTTNAPAASAK